MEPRYDRFDAATAGMEAGACSHAAAQKPPGGLTCGTATARPRPQKCTNRGQRRKRRTAVRFYRRKEPSPFSDRRTESSIGKFPFNSFRASKSVVFAGGFGTSGRKYDQAVDGKLAYISNYGGLDSALNTISVIDLAAQKALPPIHLGALRSAHGLAFAGGKLYFTVETNKAIGRYDPATQSIDWVLGTGQDSRHMVVVSESLDRIVTSNVSSGTISIIEQVSPPASGFGPPRGRNAPWGSRPPAGGPPGVGPPPGSGPRPGGPRKP